MCAWSLRRFCIDLDCLVLGNEETHLRAGELQCEGDRAFLNVRIELFEGDLLRWSGLKRCLHASGRGAGKQIGEREERPLSARVCMCA